MSDLENETEIESAQSERAEAERFVDSILPRNRVLKVLDIKAGDDRFEIRKPIYVVGVDVLQAERGRRPDADDVVLCINVLEHAPNPLALFPVIREALKPEGIFVIELPNVVSLKGFLVRLTPWSIRRWFYAHVLRAAPANRPASSVHSLSLRPSSLLRRPVRAAGRSSTSERTKVLSRSHSAIGLESWTGAGGLSQA